MQTSKELVLGYIQGQKVAIKHALHALEQDITEHSHTFVCYFLCTARVRQRHSQRLQAELMRWESFDDILVTANPKDVIAALDQIITVWKAPLCERFWCGLTMDWRRWLSNVHELDIARSHARDFRLDLVQKIQRQHTPPPLR
jgi:hypothetical protein